MVEAMNCVLFPGQGCQFPGMGEVLYETSALAKKRFATASEILGYSLPKLCFSANDKKLDETKYQQPAIFVLSYALYEQFCEWNENFSTSFYCGHSLGEYTALAAAGVCSFEETLGLVKLRGQLMQEACREMQPAMVAVMNASLSEVESLCAEVSENPPDEVAVANINSPKQLVLSGSKSGVEKVCLKLKEIGIRRFFPLKVNAAFHSNWMKKVVSDMKPALHRASFKDASIPIISNVSATPVVESETIKKLLIEQISAPVRFVDIINYACEQGSNNFYEFGPKSILCSLVKQINGRTTSHFNLGSTL